MRIAEGQFRVIYVASFPTAIYVLHAFEKKSRKTARQDLELRAGATRGEGNRERKVSHGKACNQFEWKHPS